MWSRNDGWLGYDWHGRVKFALEVTPIVRAGRFAEQDRRFRQGSRIMPSCSLDQAPLSREASDALALQFEREEQAKAVRNGKRDGRRWAKSQATSQELRRLKTLRDRCRREADGWWEECFHHLHRTEGRRAVADYLACVILGVPLDDDLADEFWESVYTDANPHLYRPADYTRGFAEGALGVWSTPAGKRLARQHRSLGIGTTPRAKGSRFILCVDQDKYCNVLHAELRRTGGRVINADWRTVERKLAAKDCDVAVFDVRAYPTRAESFAQWSRIFPVESFPQLGQIFQQGVPGQPDPAKEPVPDRYGLIRDISRSAWGRTHAVVVYSHVPKSTFRKLAIKSGIDLAQVRFYCKGKREIPPELDCIREALIERPDLIGFYFSEKDRPKAITKALIDREPLAYSLVELYMTKLLEDWMGENDRRLFDTLPAGYRIVYALWRFFGDVANGGFGQFLGNALSVEESGALIVDTVDALRRVGLTNLAEMTQEAIRLCARDVPESVVRACVTRPRRKGPFESRYPANHPDAIERQIDSLDVEFNAMDYGWSKVLDAYLKQHPGEFIHPVKRQSTSRRSRSKRGRR